jgi:hypothetical protein
MNAVNAAGVNEGLRFIDQPFHQRSMLGPHAGVIGAAHHAKDFTGLQTHVQIDNVS